MLTRSIVRSLRTCSGRLSKAFDAFFRRVKAGEKPGYPRFKSASRFDSFTSPQAGFRLAGDKLHLSKLGSCRVRLTSPY